MGSPVPMKWIFCGDSVTHGAKHTFGGRDYTELFSERLRWELARYRDIVIKTGVKGRTAKEVLADIEWSVLQFKPDVVSMMLGINDCRMGTNGLSAFKDDYRRIIDRIRKADASVIILHTPNITWMEAKDGRDTLPLYVEEIRRIANQCDLPLVDHSAHWLSAIQQKPIRATAWMNDSLHPGQYGHVELAHLLLKELGLWSQDSDVCRLFTP